MVGERHRPDQGAWYTEIGRKARIAGTVGFELLLAESGKVVCIGLTKKLPMGLSKEARKTVRSWRFAPLSAGHGLARGQLTFEFDFVEIPPPPY